jgi:hypothetical protein
MNVCRATIINSIDVPAAPLDLACLANAPAVLRLADAEEGHVEPPCTVKHVTTANGGQVRTSDHLRHV